MTRDAEEKAAKGFQAQGSDGLGGDASLLLNASNLRTGGGVQVAVSIVHEMAKYRPGFRRIDFALSSEVASGVKRAHPDIDLGSHLHVIDCHGFRLRNRTLELLSAAADVTITVFGPLYLASKPRRSVVGFAQPWIAYPQNELYERMRLERRLLERTKNKLRAAFVRKNSDLIVVEAEHVATALSSIFPGLRGSVKVVPNCLNSVFVGAKIAPVHLASRCEPIRLGFLGRNYPHKNLSILPEVHRLLNVEHGLPCQFHVTFSDTEWRNASQAFRDVVVNHGVLSIDQCPGFYNAVDAVIFPSLLECFSATPLEAMAMGRPLFASDRPFVRDVCGNHAIYFDPTSPADVAAKIATAWRAGPEALAERVAHARVHALAWPSARERAEGYLAAARELIARSEPAGRAA